MMHCRRRTDDVVQLGHERREVVEVVRLRGAVVVLHRQAGLLDFLCRILILEADENGVSALDVGAERL